MVPHWLHLLSLAGLALGVACALAITVDLIRHPQQMWIMNAVWPITALFGTVITLGGYFAYGRLATAERAAAAKRQHREKDAKTETPFAVKVAKGASHCGAGCTLGDILAEWLVFVFPVIAVWFGWHSLFAERMYAVWVVDYLFAFAIGIAFQYFTIKPMRNLGPRDGLLQAVKADALSLTAWQVGMYGFMAFASFYLLRGLLGARLATDSAEFWFMMQLAMLCGFATSYPVNWLLIRRGIKEAM